MASPRTVGDNADTGSSTRLATVAPALQASPPPSRSSKRANSSVSAFERSKFRSKLEPGYSMYTTSPSPSDRSPHDANTHHAHALDTDETGGIAGSPSLTETGPRHYSASSVINTHTFVGKSLMSPFAPQMEHLWASKTLSDEFPIKLIDQKLFKTITNWHYSNPLPECEAVFPWLHGIHHSNQNQKAFFASLMDFTSVERNNFNVFENQSKIPSTARGLMTVRSCPIFNDEDVEDPNLRYNEDSGLLKGSVEPAEILCPLDVSKQDLVLFLNAFLKDININDLHPDISDSILTTLLEDCGQTGLIPLFRNRDPEKGISLRNFHIQVAKMAQISDFVVYCFNDDHFDHECKGKCMCAAISRLLYFAQLKHGIEHPELVDPLFQTVILEKNDLEFYRQEGNERLLVLDKVTAKDSMHDFGRCCSNFDIECFKNWDTNYLLREKIEISKMSSATPVSKTVYFGNTTDYQASALYVNTPVAHKKKRRTSLPLYIDPENSTVVLSMKDLADNNEDLLVNKPTEQWGFLINCREGASFPHIDVLERLLAQSGDVTGVQITFPPSGSVGIGDCTDNDLMSIINTCKLVYIKSTKKNPALIYCADGYTESSLFGVCYLIYSTGKSFTEVLLDLHKKHGRPFFLFPTDVQLISRIETILQLYTPTSMEKFESDKVELPNNDAIYKNLFHSKETSWCTKLNASLPSRVLSHLYLGSLNHANSFELLQELGIQNIVSVGESLVWLEDEEHATRRVVNPNITVISNFRHAPVKKLMCVNNIQDDGIDMLTHNLNDVLEFINDVFEAGEKVLVHCRVGVSRSATVCIAEVMKRLNVNLIRAYIYVRVRRLNIIIQPNLRFMYELVKWEESQRLEKIKGRLKKASVASSSGSGSGENNDAKSVELTRLSASVSSMSSIMSAEISDISRNLQFLDAASSPVAQSMDSAVVDDDEEDVLHNGEYTEDDWLRDVDWHVLCREIDQLNRAYIRS